MKKVLIGFTLLFFYLFNVTNIYSQNSDVNERSSYVDEINKQTFMSLGNNDLMYYNCFNECIDVEIIITEKYWKGIKTSKKIKQELGTTLLEQYTYLFYSKGFKSLTIKIESLEPISKELKLNR